MWREGLQQAQEIAEDRDRLYFPGYGLVDKGHHFRDRGVETQAFEIFSHLFDGGMENLLLRRRGRSIANRSAQFDFRERHCATLRISRQALLEFRFARLIDKQPPDTA